MTNRQKIKWRRKYTLYLRLVFKVFFDFVSDIYVAIKLITVVN